MSEAARYTIEFLGGYPHDLKVGDELTVTGKVTVRAITADLVDITALGTKPQFTLGQIAVDLQSNHIAVSRP